MKKRKPTAGERTIKSASQALALTKGKENDRQEMARTPWHVYQELDPGPGGYAIALQPRRAAA
jgi:hypothetical protein